jgi:hypothetical protein
MTRTQAEDDYVRLMRFNSNWFMVRDLNRSRMHCEDDEGIIILLCKV